MPFSARLEYNSEISGFINPSTISSRLHTVQLLKYVFHFVQKERNENISANFEDGKQICVPLVSRTCMRQCLMAQNAYCFQDIYL